MSGAALKQEGMDLAAGHNSRLLEQILLFLKQCQIGHLRTINHDKIFTVEELVRDFERVFYKKVPTNLNGSIGSQLRRREIVEETGKWVEASREERHSNKVPQLRWALY